MSNKHYYILLIKICQGLKKKFLLSETILDLSVQVRIQTYLTSVKLDVEISMVLFIKR